MKPFISPRLMLRTFASRDPARPIFWHAVLLSVVVHLCAFLLSALLLLGLFLRPETSTPQAIEFVFLPETPLDAGTEAEAAALPRPEEAEADPLPAAPPPIDAEPERDDERIAIQEADFSPGETTHQEATPLASGQSGTAPAEASPSPNYLPNQADRSPIKSTHHFSRKRLHADLPQRFFDDAARLSPPQLQVPAPEQRVLMKKLRKMTERFVPPTRLDSSFVLQHDGADYTVKMRHIAADSPHALDELVVEVETEKYGQRLRTTMNMRRLAFSHFAQFIDYWDPRVMVHDDEFDGRFHTNTPFTMSANRFKHPRFHGKVTTSSYNFRQFEWPPAFVSSDSIFRGGLETGIAEIKFPRNFAYLTEVVEDDSSCKVFHDEAWITFHRDGSFSWRQKSGKRSVQPVELPKERPFTILSRNKKKLHVKGVVDGQVLVYASGDLVIAGNLVYAVPPELDGDSDDYLGLVSERDVEIARPGITGDGDLHVHAAILARNYFRVTQYQQPEHAKLYIHGSLTAGSLTATEPRYGTRIRFDTRLESRRPPHFPMSDRYELQEWDQMWRVEPDSTTAGQ